MTEQNILDMKVSYSKPNEFDPENLGYDEWSKGEVENQENPIGHLPRD